MRPIGLFAVAKHAAYLESRATRAEAFDDQFRDALCAVIFAGDRRALEWLEAVAEAHRHAWTEKNNRSKI